MWPASLTWTPDGGSDGAALDVDTRKVEVLVRVGVPATLELEDAQVPVGAVGRGRRRHGRDDAFEGSVALRVPETDRAATTELLFRTS